MTRTLLFGSAAALACMTALFIYDRVHLARKVEAASHDVATAVTPAAPFPERPSAATRALVSTQASAPASAAAMGEPPNPRIGRDRVIAEVTRSGADTSSPRITEAFQILSDVRSAAQSDGSVRISDIDCYRRGCFADVTFRDEPSVVQNHDRLGEAAKQRWSGGVFVSGPEHRPDGSITCSLVLLSTDN